MKRLRSKFIAFIINRFVPDYQKIKAENIELKKDIYNLIRKENEVVGLTTKIRLEMTFDISDMFWFGDAT